jgi:hypothetical protein
VKSMNMQPFQNAEMYENGGLLLPKAEAAKCQ